MGYTNSSLVSYTKISPNRNSPRNHKIDTITIHCIVGQWTAKQGCDYFANASRRASANYIVGKDGSIGLCVEEKDRSWCSDSPSNDHRAITIEVASDTTTPYAVTDAALSALIKLCADICKRNGINELKWQGNKALIGQVDKQNMTVHRWFENKSCPGDYLYSRHEYIANEVNKLLGATSSINTGVVNNTSYTLTQFVKDIQKAIGVSVDGIVGEQTLSKLPTVSKSKNNKHAVIKPLQKYLNALGYDCGIADGIAGAKFDTAAKAWAKANNCTADGEFTAGGKSWKVILGYGSASTSTSKTTSTTPSSSSVNYTYKGVNYSLVFNPTYYSNKYADLKNAFGTNATKLFEHFTEYGMKEGRQACESFNVTVYKDTYDDLRNAFGNDLPSYYKHYIQYGYKEKRKAI